MKYFLKVAGTAGTISGLAVQLIKVGVRLQSMKITRQKKRVAITAASLALGLSFLAPIKIPYSIRTPGKVLPATEWFLIRGADARLSSALFDHTNGIPREYTASQFERGDDISFKLSPFVLAGHSVVAGDTIAVIYSRETDRRAAQLSGKLQAAKAALAVLEAGEKDSQVAETQQRLEHARKLAQEQERILERQQSLFDHGLVSKQGLELARSQAELRNINIEIARAHLESMATGAKQEQIDLAFVQIRALEAENEILSEQLAQQTLTSPISGVVLRMAAGDTILAISDTTSYVAIMPIEWHERNSLRPGFEVRMKIPGTRQKYYGKITQIGNDCHRLAGKQFSMVIAKFEDCPGAIGRGVMSKCVISGNSFTLAQYVFKLLRATLV